MNNEIFEKLKNIIEDINDDSDISMDTNLMEEELFDSLETVTYFNDIEEEFDVSLSGEIFTDKKLYIVKNMIEFIKESE